MRTAKTYQPHADLSTHHAIYPTSKLKAYVVLLVFSKGLVAMCYFVIYDTLKVVHVVQFLFVTKAIASIVLILIQKPFSSGKKIGKPQWMRVIHHALFSSLLVLVQLFGLSLCGPLRSVLLIEHRDVAVVAAAAALFTGSGGNSKLRGAVCFLVGVFSLIFLDHDEIVQQPTEHPEGHLHHGISHAFYYAVSRLGLVDHKAGVILLVVSLCLQAGLASTSRRIAVDVGGSKRLNALSTLASAILLAPWALFLHLTQTLGKFHWSNYAAPFASVAVVMYVTDYYVEAVCTAKLDGPCASRISSLSCFVFGLAASVGMAGESKHDLSGGVLLAWIMFVTATVILTTAPLQSARGTFVGYSASGLPLYTLAGDAIEKTSRSFLLVVKGGLKQILDESDSRKIFYFLCLNMAFTMVEMMYGIWTNSLGLISDGFHMLFDCSALIMGLCASLLARKKPTKTFPFGYGRIEVLSGFINGLFLVVVAFMVLKEALARLVDPPQILTARLLTVSVAGLVVNLLGILVFRHAHHHQHSHGGNANLQGVFLHIVADTLGSVGVIVSSLLIEYFGLYVADPVCSIFISLLIFASVLPLLKQTASVLLLRTPQGLEKLLAIALNKVMEVPGVLSYRSPHFWLHSADVVVGSIHVQVAPSSSEQKITNQVSGVFRELGFVHFTVQVEKESFFQHMSGLGNELHNMLRSAQKSLDVKTV